MSAKKLGRYTAGLFVALGLAFGGAIPVTADGSGAMSVAADTATIDVTASQLDFEWN